MVGRGQQVQILRYLRTHYVLTEQVFIAYLIFVDCVVVGGRI